MTRTLTIVYRSHVDDAAWHAMAAEIMSNATDAACDFAASAPNDEYDVAFFEGTEVGGESAETSPARSDLMRTQCKPCPWRVLEEIPDDVQAAAANGADFVCHTRCGPCPGPVLAGVQRT